MRSTPALIVGGGPAGAAAAIGLARAGTMPLLLERTREPADALCGGFLSWRTLTALERLGVAADALNPAAVTRVRLFARHAHAEAPLPRSARAVSRRRLDTLLLAQAAAAGVRIERGVTAREIAGTVARTDDGAEVAGEALFLASGKHDIRGTARPKPGGDPTLGLRVRLAASPTLDRLVGDAIELHLFDRGYAGLVRQEDGSANLCLAVRRSRLSAAGSPAALLRALGDELPVLGERLAALDTAAVDAVANVPYGWRATGTEPGVWRLGDQAAVIPSLAGEGIGIALASGVSAARGYSTGEHAVRWQRGFAVNVRRPLGVAGVVWRLVERPLLAELMARLATPRLIQVVANASRIAHPS